MMTTAMHPWRSSLLFAALLLAASAVAVADRIDSSAEVVGRLEDEGFSHVRVIEFDGLFWHAEAIDPDGRAVAVRIEPAGGEIGTRAAAGVADPPVAALQASQPLDELEFRQLLTDAGYHGIHDVEFEDGIWRAEAYDDYGDDFEIRADAGSGRIVHVDDD